MTRHTRGTSQAAIGDLDGGEIDLSDLPDDVETSFDTDPTESKDVSAPSSVDLSLKRIGGIDAARVTLRPGISVLSGENATNRTSLLRGLCAVLGADETTPATQTLTTDADGGEVRLTIGDDTYTRTYERTRGGSITTGGNPYSGDAGTVDAFVALMEGNPARRVIERGGDGEELRDVLMRPVDTAAIDRQISKRKRQRQQIDGRLDEIETERERLPELEERREDLTDDRQDVEARIDEVESEVEAYDASEEEAERAEELLEELQTLRTELGDAEERVAYHREKIEEYRAEHEEVTTRLDRVDVPEAEIERVEDAISRVENRRRRVRDAINDLDSVIRVNERVVEGESVFAEDGAEGSVDGEATDGTEAVTAALNPETERIDCWTCGTEVERRAVRDRLDTVRDLRAEKRATVEELADEIDDLRDEKAELAEGREAYRDLQSRAETLQEQIDHHEAEVESLEDEATTYRDEIADLEARVEETETLRESELVTAYRRLSELEYERGRIEGELTDVEKEIEHLESLADEKAELEAVRGDLTEALEALRDRVDAAEAAAVDAFNEHMANLVDVLDYQNLARVWLERKPGESAADPGAFELHIVRERDDGSVYEDTVDTLSESEREVVGLVVALAGYIVHRVYDDVPFIVLDALEAIDAQRISDLLTYFVSYTGFLVAALLPEDAAAVEALDGGESAEGVPVRKLTAASFATASS